MKYVGNRAIDGPCLALLVAVLMLVGCTKSPDADSKPVAQAPDTAKTKTAPPKENPAQPLINQFRQALLNDDNKKFPKLVGQVNRTPDATGPVLAEVGERLGSSREEIRLRAVQAAGMLKAQPDQRVALLLRGLDDKDLTVKRESATQLARQGAYAEALRPTVKPLLKHLYHKDPKFQKAVSRCLALQADVVLPLMLKQLETGKVPDKIHAVNVMSQMGPSASPAVLELIQWVDHDDQGLRQAVSFALEKIGPNLIDGLSPALASGEVELRDMAQQALVKMGNRAVPMLIRGLESENPIVQGAARATLISFDSQPKTQIVGRRGTGRWPKNARARQELIKVLAHREEPNDRLINNVASFLADDNPGVRSQAILALAGWQVQSLPALKQALASENRTVRWSAVVAIERLANRVPGATDLLVPAVKDQDPAISAAAQSIMSRRPEGMVGFLARQLSQGNVATRRAAALALAEKTDNIDTAALSALIAGLRDNDEQVRALSLQALTGMGERAWPASGTLAALLSDEKLGPQAKALLGVIGPKAIDGLLQAMNGTDPASRSAAVKALADMGPKAEPAVPSLVVALSSADTRADASKALKAIGPKAHKGLLAALENQDVFVRLYAAAALPKESLPTTAYDVIREAIQAEDSSRQAAGLEVLTQMGPASEPLVEPLVLFSRLDENTERVKAVSDWVISLGPSAAGPLAKIFRSPGKFDDRFWASEFLRQLGPKAEPALPVIRAMLMDNDADPALRQQCLVLLAALGEKAGPAVRDLSTLYRQATKPETQAQILDTMAALGPKAEDGMKLVQQALLQGSPPVQLAALKVVRVVKPKGTVAVKIMNRMLLSKDAQVRAQTALTLGGMGVSARTSADGIARLLRDDDQNVQESAAQALWMLGEHTKMAIPDITNLLRDRSDRVRQLAAWTLGGLPSQKSARVVAGLEKLSSDKEPAVADEASKALERLDQPRAKALPELPKRIERNPDS